MMKTEKWFFLRGLARESGHWGKFLPAFAAVFPHRKIIAVDLPGTGSLWLQRSPRQVAQIVAEVRNQYLAEKGDLNYIFAVSLGGMVAAEWMRLHPDDFQGAVLVNTSIKGISPFYRRLLPSVYSTILKLFFSGSAEAREREILRITSNRPEFHESLAREWAAIAERRPISKSTALNQLLAAMKYNAPLAAPGKDILLLNSAQDHLCSPTCSEDLAHVWKVPLKTHPNAGHDLTLDDPEWVLDALRP